MLLLFPHFLIACLAASTPIHMTVGSALAGSGVQEESPKAPDGRPGLGTARTARELGRVFRAPTEEDESFLKGLFDLPGEILVMREMARRSYKQSGYFNLVSNSSANELGDLQDRFGELQKQAEVVLTKGGEPAKVFASLMVDLRFQLRGELFEIFEQEGPELRGGLGLLAGSQNGLYDLKDKEARLVARRVDLSAARLRAVRSDLDALRERGTAGILGVADPTWRQELLGLAAIAGQQQREQALQVIRKKLNRRLQRLDSMLFTPRLDPRIDTALGRRQAVKDQAKFHLERVQRYLLRPPFDLKPRPELLEMSRSERHRFAVSEGLRGIDVDPLNEELTYLMGVASAELLDPKLSRPWFDRYLALRGIRSDERGTLKGRELTLEETNALEQVMGAFLGRGADGFPR